MAEFKLTAKQGERIFARLEDLEKRVRALEKGQRAPAPAPKETPKEEPTEAPAKKPGFLDRLKGW